MTNSHAAREIDTSRPHSARMYDYYLGGKDHFDVDKQAAETVAAVYPGIFTCARENRAFMHRVSGWTSAPASPPSRTCTRSRSPWLPRRAWSTPTTTPWSSSTPSA